MCLYLFDNLGKPEALVSRKILELAAYKQHHLFSSSLFWIQPSLSLVESAQQYYEPDRL